MKLVTKDYAIAGIRHAQSEVMCAIAGLPVNASPPSTFSPGLAGCAKQGGDVDAAILLRHATVRESVLLYGLARVRSLPLCDFSSGCRCFCVISFLVCTPQFPAALPLYVV